MSSPGRPRVSVVPGGAHAMKFALFYEIPVPRPWERRQRADRLPEHPRAGHRRRPLRLARLLDGGAPLPAGVLALLEPRGALRRHRGTDRAHPAGLRRAPDAQALQPSRAHGGVGGRARPALERAGRPRAPGGRPRGPSSRGSASTPPRAAACGRRPSATSWAAGPTTSTSSRASTGRCPGAGCSPSRGRSRTRPCGARRPATRVTRRWATSASGLCSFAVGLPPSEVKRKIDIYREAVGQCNEPIGSFVNNQAATFTMAICAPGSRQGDGRGPRILRVVSQDGCPPDRHAHRLDGGAQPGARYVLLRGGDEEAATTRACSTSSASNT